MPAAPRKDEILRAGRALLMRHGIRKVRVEEVCADAGVSKRTFYKYFANKDALALAVLAQLFEENGARLEAVLSSDAPLEDKVRQILSIKTQLASETSATFYREVLDDATAPGRFALQQQSAWDQRVRRFYVDAQRRGQIRRDVDLDILMALMVRSRHLVRDPELLALAPDLAQLTETVMTVFFYGIVPRAAGDAGRAVRRARRSRP